MEMVMSNEAVTVPSPESGYEGFLTCERVESAELRKAMLVFSFNIIYIYVLLKLKQEKLIVNLG
jgi:hypothetical protein